MIWTLTCCVTLSLISLVQNTALKGGSPHPALSTQTTALLVGSQDASASLMKILMFLRRLQGKMTFRSFPPVLFFCKKGVLLTSLNAQS